MRKFRHLQLALSLVMVFPAMLPGQYAIQGDQVYTMAGEMIRDGVVLVSGSRIERVGSAERISIPSGYQVLKGAVVTPGLIDAHSVVGLAGIYNQPHDQDQLEKSDPMQPELRALDAYNPREELVAWVRSLGVTTLHTGHAPGALASGQSMVVKTHGNTIEEVLMDSTTMITMTLGATVGRNYKSPGTRAKGISMLRQELMRAQSYQRKQETAEADKKPDRDLRMEALAALLQGKITALITAHRVTEILAAIRLAEEFGFPWVLDGAAESYLLIDEIKRAGLSVILHPTMVRNYGDTRNATYETAAKLHAAGIRFAFQSGYESYVPKSRIILYEAAIACANGLPPDAALAALTIDSARILGIDDRVGSLEAGKDADLVIFDGDPFEYTSHVCKVMIGGVLVNENCH